MVPRMVSFPDGEEEEELPRMSKMIDKTREKGIRKPNTTDTLAYLMAVKDVFDDDRANRYRDFLQLLKDFRTKRLDVESLMDKVEILFEGYPDLVESFNTFLPRGYEIIIRPTTIDDDDDDDDDDSVYEEEAVDFEKRVQATRLEDEYHVHQSLRNKSSILPTVAKVSRVNQDSIAGFIQSLPSSSSCAIDQFNSESFSPSYIVLPEDYTIPVATRRTELDSQVLNDRFCSTPSAYSCSRVIHRTQCEQSLFQCEDGRFELDMLLGSVKSTIDSGEKLLEKMIDDRISESICIEDHLTVLNLRCIERMYGKQGLEVVNVLRENAQAALPVILDRLKQKQQEWEQCRSDFNQVWAQVYAMNYNNQVTTPYGRSSFIS